MIPRNSFHSIRALSHSGKPHFEPNSLPLKNPSRTRLNTDPTLQSSETLYDNGSDSPTPETSHAIQTGALKSATALLCDGIRSDGTYEDVPEGELCGFQWRRLKDWAATQGLILPHTLVPERFGGREHDLLFHQNTHWYKFTKDNSAGYTVDLSEEVPLFLPATPLQYLQRWKLHNRLFNDNVELAGISTPNERTDKLVIVQQDIQGAAPSWDALEAFFVQDLGYQRLYFPEPLGHYESRAYCLGRYAIFDVRPINCVETDAGLIIPIDVIPKAFPQREAQILKRYV